jgi:hypothetical protein
LLPGPSSRETGEGPGVVPKGPRRSPSGAQEVSQEGAQERRESCGWCPRRKKENKEDKIKERGSGVAWGAAKGPTQPQGGPEEGTEGQKKVQSVL